MNFHFGAAVGRAFGGVRCGLVALAVGTVLGAVRSDGEPSRLAGDVDGNGTVDEADVRALRAALAQGAREPSLLPSADVTQDGRVQDDDAEVLVRRVAGQPTLLALAAPRHVADDRLEVGDAIRVGAAETFRPFDVESGSVRITSASQRYDSGEQALVFERDGRSLYWTWDTALRSPAPDYTAVLRVRRRGGATETEARVAMDLKPHTVEGVVVRASDLSLPYWGLGLVLERTYTREAHYGIARGSLGYGWRHRYEVRLEEQTDGSLSVLFGDGTGGVYVRTALGVYRPPFWDHSSLTRDPDGAFQLRRLNGERWRFTPDLRLTAIHDGQGHRIDVMYDAEGNLSKVRDAAGQAIDFVYDAVEPRLLRATDSLGRSVHFDYGAAGDLVRVTDSIGRATSYAYEPGHRLARIEFPDGRQRLFAYDKQGRLASESLDGGVEARTYAYADGPDGTGLRTLTDAVGNAWRYETIGDMVLRSVRDPLGRTLSYAHDDRLRTVGMTDLGGGTWRIVPDSLGRPARVTDPEGAGRTVLRAEDGDQLLALTDGNGNATRFDYDPAGRPSVTTFADGSKETSTYTWDKSLTWVTVRKSGGATLRRAYEARGLLVVEEAVGGPRREFAYAPSGQVIRAAVAGHELTYAYDAAGRLERAESPGKRAFVYTYDAADRVTRTVDPDGRTTTYEYDAAGRLTEIRALPLGRIATYEYDPMSRPVQRTLGNGCTTRSAYDAAGRLVRLVHAAPDGQPVLDLAYAYDANDNLLSRGVNGKEEAFVHDRAGRLRSAKYADGTSEAFGYDAAGNMTSWVRGGVEARATLNALNQVMQLGETTCRYDGDGNLAELRSGDRRTVLHHDGLGQLARVEGAAGGPVTLGYDAFGRLAGRSGVGDDRRFLHDGMQMAIEEDPAHRTLVRRIWGGSLDELLVEQGTAAPVFVHQDLLGSVWALTDGAGKTVGFRRYAALGRASDPPITAIGFVGARAEGDFVCLRARWLALEVGRFAERDPAGFDGTGNPYAYVDNCPLTVADPLGLCSGSGPGGGGGRYGRGGSTFRVVTPVSITAPRG